MARDVFVSYASATHPTAMGVVDALEAGSVSCWIAPRDIADGASWPDAIAKAIASAQLVLVVVSAPALGSAEVTRELALAGGTPILAVRVEDVEPSDGLRYFLAAAHWLDAFAPTTEAHHARIVTSVDRCLADAREPASAESPRDFVPPTAAMIRDLSAALGEFQDLAIKLLAVLDEASQVLVDNDDANQMLIDCAIAFNAFAPGFIRSLPAYAASVRKYWGIERAEAFAELQAVIERDVYRGGIGALNDLRATLNELRHRAVDAKEWRLLDEEKRERLRSIRRRIDHATTLWTALRSEMDLDL